MSITSNSSKKAVVIASHKLKVSGVILVDKPSGMTSQQVVSKVKYLFKSPMHDSKKAGHTGTLDPMATGLLPICLGEATKFSHYQLDADKTYQATILLGSQTDTGDAEGTVIAQLPILGFDTQSLNAIAQRFLGAQQQIPPMYSALKKEGKKLYEYARAGIEVERAPRNIVIKKINLIKIDDKHIQLTVTCSKGTYVRVLAEDIAKNMSTLGHLTALRRLQAGDFKIDSATPLTALETMTLEQRLQSLLPIQACIDVEPELMLTPEQCKRVRMGQRLNVSEQLSARLKQKILDAVNQLTIDNESAGVYHNHSSDQKTHSLDQPTFYDTPVDIRLIDTQHQFIGLGSLSLHGRLQPKRLIQP